MEEIIKKLNLQPHPEGGYYAETFRSDIEIECDFINKTDSKRNASTCIYFLVTPGKCSRLHRIRSDEVWHFYLGGPLTVIELVDHDINNPVRKTILGQNILEENQVLQHVVKRDTWFGCYNENTEFSLVGCSVAPGFDFKDFELASRQDLLSKYPKAAEDIIITLTEGLP